MTESTARIVNAIRSIPRGKLACYRDIGIAAGLPNGARQVARVLHSLAESQKLPWHRVVRADGSIALPPDRGGDVQVRLLRAEGVEVGTAASPDCSAACRGQSARPYWVDMEKYGTLRFGL
jgi:methylated-DNA-protein-cysteine methyltransferase-like protein